MILTGSEIAAAHGDGRLRIEPFAPEQVNPNSYNVRLGKVLLTYTGAVLDPHRHNPTAAQEIPDGGLVLHPGQLYLGHTAEQVGSDVFVPLLFGRSSVGRLGLFVEIGVRHFFTGSNTASPNRLTLQPGLRLRIP